MEKLMNVAFICGMFAITGRKKARNITYICGARPMKKLMKEACVCGM